MQFRSAVLAGEFLKACSHRITYSSLPGGNKAHLHWNKFKTDKRHPQLLLLLVVRTILKFPSIASERPEQPLLEQMFSPPDPLALIQKEAAAYAVLSS